MADITYIALLRGINVGRAKRVAMADLRAVVETLGYGDVRTLLNSGNVVFTGPRGDCARVADRVEGAIARRLGVSARVTVLSAAELDAAAAANALLDVSTDPSRLLVAVPADSDQLGRLKPLLKRDWTPEAFAIGPRAAYLWCPDGVIASRIAASVERELGNAVTMRNWATITKIIGLAGEKPR